MIKRIIKIFVLILIVISFKNVCALTQTSAQKRINIDSNTITLYVGNVSVDGESRIKYLFTDRAIGGETYDVIESLLDDDYKNLLPSKPGYTKRVISNDSLNSYEIDSNWSNASYVANKYYGDVGLITNSNEYLFDINHFNELKSQYLIDIQNDNNAIQQYNTDYETEKANWESTNDGDFSELYSYLPPVIINNVFDSIEDDELVVDGSTAIQPGYAKYNGKMVQYSVLLRTKVKLKIVSTNVNVVSPKYDFIFGNDQIYTLGMEIGAAFRIDIDYSYFENGGKVYVDDKLIDSNNYVSESGSTIITLKKEYLDTLSIGVHSFKVVFNNDGVAETNFYVANAANEFAPNTGDKLLPYIVNLLFSLLCLGFISKKLFINKNN